MKRQTIYKSELEIETQWAVRHKDGPVSVQDSGYIMSRKLYVKKVSVTRQGKEGRI